MSPTVFRESGFRFYFFSREEKRMHVHVQCAEGEAKYWLEPAIELAHNYGLNERQLRSAKALIEAHNDDIRSSWARLLWRLRLPTCQSMASGCFSATRNCLFRSQTFRGFAMRLSANLPTSSCNLRTIFTGRHSTLT
jgi:Domain of unknown function (DUF4160)